MKLKFKFISALAVLGIAITACDDEGKRFPDFQPGVNARLVLYPERSYINLDDLSNASVAFDIYSINDNLEEIVYEATFTDADSATAKFPTVEAFSIPASAFVDGKATEIEISAAELAEKFGLPGGIAYYEGGDKIAFKTIARLTDGREFTADNSAPSITGGASASFTSNFDIFVGCPSPVESIEGEYWAIMEYNNYGLSIGDTVDVEVELAGPEPFRYQVSDHTVELYVPFGGTQYPATFYDLCGSTVLQPATSFGNVVHIAQSEDPNLLAPNIVINGEDTEFVLNWYETGNVIIASVRFVKKN